MDHGPKTEKDMKKILTIAIVLLFSLTAFGQQESQFTNFVYNQQLYNPAYVGSRNTPSFTALHRSQWLGFEGAPNSQLISFQTPIMKQRAGLGGTIFRRGIGVSNNWLGSAAYSYNLRITQEIDLRLGIQASLEYLGVRFSDPSIITVTRNDPSANNGSYDDNYSANVGVGFHLSYKDLFYFGASSPQLYPNNLSFNDLSNTPAKAFPHRYFVLGAVIPATDDIEVMPNMLIKWVDQAPLDVDVNVMVRWKKMLTGGLTYRAGGNNTGDSMDLLLFYQFNQKIGAGLSYDFTLSDIKDYSSGSIELVARYDLRDEKGNLENPRYFKKK
ncbi:MAG TPA: type IX secretion system membrane protein PorP/SprF [Bacteroidetes bacterium]|nr:type IX secretion system membrane protein PorP/SprF [Bacteroidota bacterium]